MAEYNMSSLINSTSFIKTCALVATGALVGYAVSKSKFKEEERKAKEKQLTEIGRVEDPRNILKFLREKLRPYPPSLERKFTRQPDSPGPRDDHAEIRIMQWNTLARALCAKDAFARAPDDAYDWERYRKWRTLEELIRRNADIVCLQETDAYEELKPYMHAIGYTSVFCPKFASPCLEMEPNWGPDGCSVFYRLAKFQVVNTSCEKIVTDGEVNSQTFVVMHLRHRASGNRLTVVCLHLKSKVANHDKRTQQIGEILKHLFGLDKNLARYPLVVCGDFNGEPFEKFYELLVKVSELGLQDAYSLHGDKEPTTIKFRGEGGALLRRAIDYMFFTPRSLKLTSLLELPVNDLLVNEQGLPNLAYSSDHLSLVCDFRFEEKAPV